jgi:hypothetical protein
MGPQINGCCAIVSPAGCGLSAGDPDGFGYGGRVRKPPTWCVAWRNAQNHSAGWVRAKAPTAGHVASPICKRHLGRPPCVAARLMASGE